MHKRYAESTCCGQENGLISLSDKRLTNKLLKLIYRVRRVGFRETLNFVISKAVYLIKGKEKSSTRPLPVRLFEARIDKLQVSLEVQNKDIEQKTIKQLQNDIKSLPQNSVIILDNKEYLDKTSDPSFWNNITSEKTGFLRMNIAPVMRAKSDADFKAMHFEFDVVELSTAYLLNNKEKYETFTHRWSSTRNKEILC